jgi:hypothetical protein
MAKPDKSARPLPFLKEGYALAQVLASDQGLADQLITDAYAVTAGTSRFALLEALLAGVDMPPPEPKPLAGPPVRWETTSDFQSPSVSASLTTVEAPSSLIAERLAAEKRGQDMVGRFARLSQAERAVAYLSQISGLSGADLASLFRVSPEYIGTFQDSVAHTLFGGALRPGDPELLAESLKPLVEPPGKALTEAVRQAMTVALKGPRDKVARPAPRGRLMPVLGILLISVVTALAVTRLFPRTPAEPVAPRPTDALEAAATQLPLENHQITTSDPAEVEAWIAQRIPWRFSVPNVEALPLAGAGFTQLVSGVRVPMLFYGSGETDLSIAVMNYAILQASSDRLSLDRPTIDRLATGETPELRTVDGHSVLAMRHRDDIYLAVSRQIDVALPSRISFESE